MAREALTAGERAGMEEHRFRSMACDITVLAPADFSRAEQLARGVLDAWDARFSRFRSDSELERLNDSGGRSFPVSEQMLAVLEAALAAAHATNGLFDPLLGGRLVELGYDRTFEELPSQRSTLPLAPWRSGAWREIVIDRARGTIRLPAGYRVDLGGLAKGMAVDAALDALVAQGASYAAVSAGGDLAVTGLPPGQSFWPVAIEGPAETVVTLREGALATSSVLRRRWDVQGNERHHLLDPRTGMPSAGPILQASVAAPTCAQAEVAAKVAILSDLPAALGHLEAHRLAALLFTSDGEAWRLGTWQ